MTAKEAFKASAIIGLWILAGVYATVNHYMTMDWNARVAERQHYMHELASRRTQILPPPAVLTGKGA